MAHGFRALFSIVVNEAGWRPDVIERQLAHKERNQVWVAYHCGTYMAARALLMQWWADYLDARRKGQTLAMPQVQEIDHQSPPRRIFCAG